jgi:hypothetical protein
MVNMAAKRLKKYKNPKFQSKSLKTVQFGKFFSAGRTGPVSSESRKNPAENRTVVTLPSAKNVPFCYLSASNKLLAIVLCAESYLGVSFL